MKAVNVVVPAYPLRIDRVRLGTGVVPVVASTTIHCHQGGAMPGEHFTPDLFFGLWEPAFRVPLHLSPDETSLALTVQPRRR